VVVAERVENVLVGHNDNVGEVIEEWGKAGWRVHTYACAGNAAITRGTSHYLLFEKENKTKKHYCSAKKNLFQKV
jgi:hypothetical protein